MLVALLPQLLLYGTLPLWVVTMGAGLMLLHWATAAVAAATAAAAAAAAAAARHPRPACTQLTLKTSHHSYKIECGD